MDRSDVQDLEATTVGTWSPRSQCVGHRSHLRRAEAGGDTGTARVLQWFTL